MQNLNKIDETSLAECLAQWFKQTNLIKRHLWERNKVGKVIKDNLKLIGKWKNKARGNPIKGYKVMLENKDNSF